MIAARDVPTLRDEAIELGWRWNAAVNTLQFRQGSGLLGKRGLYQGSPEEAGQRLASVEAKHLQDAEMFFVSSAMLDLAEAAARNRPLGDVSRDALPTRCGLVVFERPTLSAITTVPIHAVTWGPFDFTSSDGVAPGVLMTFYAWRSDEMAAAEGLRLPRLVPEGEEWLSWDMPWTSSDGKDDLRKIILTCLDLMMQPGLATGDAIRPDRAALRRAARKNRPAPSVRVVELRRPPGAAHAESDSTTTWAHQWAVRGHWRQQAYGPGRELRRVTWIAPHIKGPEGKPLLGGDKVYAWKR